jgi:cytochrome P450
MVFADILKEKAKNRELFRLEPLTTRLTVDIIGKVVLDTEFGSQKGSNEFVDTLVNQISWQRVGGEINLSNFDLRRPLIMKYNTWKMNRYVARLLEDRFATRSERGKTKCIIDLALDAYLKENKTVAEAKSMKLDPEFKKAAISNMKAFTFAGHDTTSSTICYCYYYLSKNPDCLSRVLVEHNTFLGADSSPAAVGEKLNQDPYLLNKLDYTSAVVREVLRLQPPASTVRMHQPSFILRDPETGEQLPTEHSILWANDVGIGRNPRYWTDPHTFNPDRFLNPDARFNKDAWIPFSKGIRNCVGQDLAMIEVKVILVMTIRAFEFSARYDELGKLKDDGSGYPSETDGVQEQFGDEAYQIQLGSAKPREGMPVRVRVRN